MVSGGDDSVHEAARGVKTATLPRASRQGQYHASVERAAESPGLSTSTAASRRYPVGPVCAIVVTYHPDADFPERFRATAAQVERVIVVDNGSVSETSVMLASLTEGTDHVLIANGTNLGVAAALNIGIREALDRGYRWAVTLDQDSTPQPGMADGLVATLEAQPDVEAVAMVGPDIVQDGVVDLPGAWLAPRKGCRFMFRRTRCVDGDPGDVTMVITSGALTNLVACDRLGGFWEGLFIDYVDTEFCLRAGRHGLRTIVSCRARLTHRLGEKRVVRWLGIEFRPTFHAPLRLRYIARNRIHVVRRHGLAAPHWLAFDLVAMTYNLIRVVLTERERGAKLAAIVAGTRDGLMGRLGAVTEPRGSLGETTR